MDIRVGWGLLDARINLINLNLECGQFAGEGESKQASRVKVFPGDDHTHTHKRKFSHIFLPSFNLHCFTLGQKSVQ